MQPCPLQQHQGRRQLWGLGQLLTSSYALAAPLPASFTPSSRKYSFSCDTPGTVLGSGRSIVDKTGKPAVRAG